MATNTKLSRRRERPKNGGLIAVKTIGVCEDVMGDLVEWRPRKLLGTGRRQTRRGRRRKQIAENGDRQTECIESNLMTFYSENETEFLDLLAFRC